MKKIFIFAILSIFAGNIYAQTNSSVTVQDTKINSLLDEKRKINSKITINDQYKIQIMHGNIEMARKTMDDFNSKFSGYDATIIFSSPNYKLWVGPFKNRIQATKALTEIKETFPRAMIIKPSK